MVRRILGATGSDIRALIGNTTVLRGLKPMEFADERFGIPTVTDILGELEKPGRDPRPAFTTASFKEGVETIEDLRPGMLLEGVVTNVAAFGAFVDVGVHQDGLVHISAMSKSFVANPREVVKPGDVVRVKVLGVDVARKRISLTLRLDDEVSGGPGGQRVQAAAGSAGGEGQGSRSRQPRPEGRGGEGQGSRGGQPRPEGRGGEGQGSRRRQPRPEGRGGEGQGSRGGQPRPEGRGGDGRGGSRSRSGRGGSGGRSGGGYGGKPGSGDGSGGGALADALRRAGLVDGPADPESR